MAGVAKFNQRPRTAQAIVVIFTLAFLLVAGVVLLADETCHRDITRRLPLYPDSEVVDTQHNFLRPFAFGTSRVVLATPDDVETVEQWRRDITLDLLDQEAFNGLATVWWRIEENPNSDGTLVYLFSECGR